MIAKSNPKAMLVAGVMSGTSADGVDVALCRISPGLRKNDPPRVKLLAHLGTPYPRALRTEVLRVMEGESVSAATLSRLNWHLGTIYAGAVERAAKKFGIRPALIGLHGQTIHHEPRATQFLGTRVRSTWQLGEAAVVAERLRCPVVSDLRPADLAAGGQGAPLVPMLDWCLFRSQTKARVLLNLGGIANMTAIPAGGTLADVIAFDSGPANMVIDACMATLFGKKFDRNGATARRGRVLCPVIETILRDAYFSAPPPKSCGREQFGTAFTTRFIAMCRDTGANDRDIVAFATALTADSVVGAYRHFVAPLLAADSASVEVFAAGGGAGNSTLMAMLHESFHNLGVKLSDSGHIGIPAQAKEAVAFALLAWLTWHGLPGNVPAATGATHPVTLGKVSLG